MQLVNMDLLNFTKNMLNNRKVIIMKLRNACPLCFKMRDWASNGIKRMFKNFLPDYLRFLGLVWLVALGLGISAIAIAHLLVFVNYIL